MPVKQTKRRNRRPAGGTVRVSGECLRCIRLAAKHVERPNSWVVEHAIAEYTLIRDLNESAMLDRRPKLEVRA
jgi:predicted transcriptional regulator